MMTGRYAAQMSLPDVGRGGQKVLADAHVLVVGAGGLGATLLPVLVGGGIGHIHIMDDDVVEEGNLHRQTLYRMSDLGQNKAEAALRHLRALNPSIMLAAYPIGAQSDTVFALLYRMKKEAGQTGHIIVLDAADNFATTYMLSDLCREMSLPLISASAIRWEGYAGIFCGNAPSYRAVFPVLNKEGQNCSTAGVLGSVVGLVGMMQAQLCFSLLLGIEPSPLGKLYRWDAKTLRMSHFSFMQAQEPEESWPFLSYRQLKCDDLVIDVRGPAERPEIAHPHLRHIPLDQFLTGEKWGFPHDTRLVLCCQSGIRATKAALYLHERGYKKLALLAMGHQGLT